MSKKLVNCKTCGAEIAKNAKVCPKCGAKSKKHPILGLIVLFIGVLTILSAIGGSSDDTNEPKNQAPDVSASSAVQPVTSENQVSDSEEKQVDSYTVGDRAVLKDVAVTLVDVSESGGTDFLTPSDGNVFLICEFEIENGSKSDIAVSSIMSFEAYADDYATTLSLTSTTSSDKNQLDGTVAAGKKMNGVVGYEVPKDWTNFEIRFTPSVWSGKDITFTINK